LLSIGSALHAAPLRARAPHVSAPIASAAEDRATTARPDVSLAAQEVAAALTQRPIYVPQVAHLRDWLPNAPALQTSFHGGCTLDAVTLEEDQCILPQLDEGTFVGESGVVLADPVVDASGETAAAPLTAYKRGGPREHVYFAPATVKAAIVTCGGLCPGLNTVVKELVSCLRSQYGVEHVHGVPHGYMGFYAHEWRELHLADVETIHRQGGSLLGSSRGGHDTAKICDAIEARGVNMVFTVGGDGTMAGSEVLANEFMRRGSAGSWRTCPRRSTTTSH